MSVEGRNTVGTVVLLEIALKKLSVNILQSNS